MRVVFRMEEIARVRCICGSHDERRKRPGEPLPADTGMGVPSSGFHAKDGRCAMPPRGKDWIAYGLAEQ